METRRSPVTTDSVSLVGRTTTYGIRKQCASQINGWFSRPIVLFRGSIRHAPALPRTHPWQTCGISSERTARSSSALCTTAVLGIVGLLAAACGGGETTTTAATQVPASSIVLSVDAIGDVPLGTTPEAVLDGLTPFFGGPSEDTDWIEDAGGTYGTCPEPLRVIAWGSLTTFHRGGPTNPEFFAYSYGFDFDEARAGVDPRGLGLSTSSGVRIGTTVAELQEAEPGVVLDGDVDIDVWTFAIAPDDTPHLRGQVTGLEAEDTVLFIETSAGCN